MGEKDNKKKLFHIPTILLNRRYNRVQNRVHVITAYRERVVATDFTQLSRAHAKGGGRKPCAMTFGGGGTIQGKGRVLIILMAFFSRLPSNENKKRGI